jgi:hypothetical protein
MNKVTFTQWPVYRGSTPVGYMVRVTCGHGVHEFETLGPVNVGQVCRMLNQRLADLGYTFDDYRPRDFEVRS